MSESYFYYRAVRYTGGWWTKPWYLERVMFSSLSNVAFVSRHRFRPWHRLRRLQASQPLPPWNSEDRRTTP